MVWGGGLEGWKFFKLLLVVGMFEGERNGERRLRKEQSQTAADDNHELVVECFWASI